MGENVTNQEVTNHQGQKINPIVPLLARARLEVERYQNLIIRATETIKKLSAWRTLNAKLLEVGDYREITKEQLESFQERHGVQLISLAEVVEKSHEEIRRLTLYIASLELPPLANPFRLHANTPRERHVESLERQH